MVCFEGAAATAQLCTALHSVLAFEGDETETETRGGCIFQMILFSFFVTRAIYSNACIYEVKNSADRGSTLTSYHQFNPDKQASTFRLIPESMNSYLPTLTIFFPLHLDLLLSMRRVHFAAMASSGENPIRKTTLRFDLYCSEVAIFLLLLLLLLMLVHDIIYSWCCCCRSISAPNS